MQLSNENLRINEKKFLKSLLSNGNKTDAQIAREIKISKATASRIRKKLEGNLISDYIPIIELHKMGINVFLVLTFRWNSFDNEQITKKVFSEFKKDPKIVFLANGEGSISSTVMFIAFEDLENYHSYLKEFRKKYGKYTDQINTLLLPSKEVIKNDFTEVIKDIIGGKQK